jgi:YaiO family outer membrane protein
MRWPLLAVFLVTPIAARAEDPRIVIDAGGESQALSSGFGTWSAGYLRGVLPAGPRDTVSAELTRRAEFGSTGTYFAAGDTHVLSDDWYASLTAGASTGAFFLPHERLDATLHRKWLAGRNLVTSIGYTHVRASDAHRDHALALGGAYYWEGPWILEGAVRVNASQPGRVLSESQFLALTRGRDRQRLVVLRAEAGREAYQLIGPKAALSRFPSQSASLTWRQWVHGRWGWHCVAEIYHSPAYRRAGVTLGIFRD